MPSRDLLLCSALVALACGGDREFDDRFSTGVDGGQETDGATGGAEADTGEARFDVEPGDGNAGDGGGNCECGEAGLDFSYIWIANTMEGTVSKLDTESMVEEGRYLARPDGAGSPSRTSVTVNGRAAAVANRYGGVTKIWARAEDCVESNGQAGIQTSTGKDDIRPWGQDECIAWHTAFPHHTTQRPVAWTAGELDPHTCTYKNEKLWTSGCGNGLYPGWGEYGPIEVHLLDGATGEVEATVSIQGKDQMCHPVGAYGGAVDGDGNFWFNRVGGGEDHLGVVELDTLAYRLYDLPDGVYAYGMTVDSQGRVWVSSTTQPAIVARFDPKTETWAVADDPGAETNGGLQEDQHHRIWVHLYGQNPNGLAAYDSETLQRVDLIDLQSGIIKGISIDVDGYVWGVSHDAAFRVDPDTHAFEKYEDLEHPYTYSDMTGWGLFHAACPKPEG